MADTSIPIASAVIVPSPPTSPSAKRGLSPAANSSAKRTRLSPTSSVNNVNINSQSPPRESTSPRQNVASRRDSQLEPPQDRRKASMQEERKRGQRLFGGLLSTLSRKEPNNQNQRRQEVEQRQVEKEKARKEGDEERKRERLAKLRSVRIAEQGKWEEQAMRTKHTNMKAMAKSLRTKTSPKLYYKPWELLPEQEDRVKQQITDISEQIEDEKRTFYSKHPDLKPREESLRQEQNETTDNQLVGDANIKPSLTSTTNADAANSPHVANSSPVKARDASVQHDEQNGDILVENDEDAVIY